MSLYRSYATYIVGGGRIVLNPRGEAPRLGQIVLSAGPDRRQLPPVMTVELISYLFTLP